MSEGFYAKTPWLQLTRGLEAVMGFAILTASVSWLLSIYPVLESRRSLAQRATLLHHAERQRQLDVVRDLPQLAQTSILELAADLGALRNQMAQFPITHYFDMGEPETALAGVLPYLLELSQRATASGVPALEISGTMLGGAVDSFLTLLATDFLLMPAENWQAVMRTYAGEQMSDLILRDSTHPYP
jgi:hypothetical protein